MQKEKALNRAEYIRMLDNVRERKWLYVFVTKGGRALTYLSYVVYPCLLIWLFVTGNENLWKAVVVPAAGFIILSVFRYCKNAPRPYEVFDMPPLIVKNTKGKSFPSRHVFSAFIIAVTAGYFCLWLGIALGICGVLLAVTRVLAGVHFTKDVAAGCISGIGLGILGFILLL